MTVKGVKMYFSFKMPCDRKSYGIAEYLQGREMTKANLEDSPCWNFAVQGVGVLCYCTLMSSCTAIHYNVTWVLR